MGKYASGFQIHLSTACILLMASSGLMWANLSGPTIIYPEIFLRPNHDDFDNGLKYVLELEIPPGEGANYFHYAGRRYGWPATVIGKWWVVRADDSEHALNQPQFYARKWSHFVLDFIVAAAVLFAVWFICEWRIGRTKKA